ncbi:MAG: alpha-glucan family phosphorylase [Verrucomicrobiae bacterium]|nr:alpha-glucan family phosphorylase [Verrucomicrobiae bacterium]
MPNFFRFAVVPNLPPRLEPLRELAFNLWFSWEPEATALFRDLDPELWEQCHHNPVRLLQRIRQRRLLKAARDEAFLARLDEVTAQLAAYLETEETFHAKSWADKLRQPVAYFSAEFGLHESVPNYSGGLGILAGDHCKTASDLGIPFVAVGILYRHGYFRQRLTREGWQEAVEMDVIFNELPIREVRRPDGTPLTVEVRILGRRVVIKVWKVRVGRIPLLLLDTDVAENSAEDRRITAELYGGDIEMRVRQEMVLGIGGVRALDAMEISPSVFHMNEGHAAFLSLERIRLLMQKEKVDFYVALQATAASNVFTTHTPVPAGNDAFSPDLMHRYFDEYVREMQIPFSDFLIYGRPWNHQPQDPFSMTILALRTSRRCNGVSRLHGKVSRKMWTSVWPEAPVHEVPIESVTNGIHLQTWLAPEMRALYEQCFGKGWQYRINDPEMWRRVSDLSDQDLWETHLLLKRRLVEFVRQRARAMSLRLGEPLDRVRAVGSLLDPEVLTLGFARRFATYKRAALIFHDPERLKTILNHPDRPVQIVMAGKAHPRDEAGKRLIQQVLQISRQPGFEGKIVFVEDYDSNVARHMVQGVDVWLNTPMRPMEASGTSGQKAPPNGIVNLSIPDGWWAEGFNGKNGWSIGAEIEGAAPPAQDDADAASLYNILDRQVVPLYYAKPDGRLPLAWINLMRESIRSVAPVFNTWRMVQEYTERFYIPAAEHGARLRADHFKEARDLANWKEEIRKSWHAATVREVVCGHPKPYQILVGEKIPIRARVALGRIPPEHVLVEAYLGESHNGDVQNPSTVRLRLEKTEEDSTHWYVGEIEAKESGLYGYNVRLMPTHPNLVQKHELRLATWGKP